MASGHKFPLDIRSDPKQLSVVHANIRAGRESNGAETNALPTALDEKLVALRRWQP